MNTVVKVITLSNSYVFIIKTDGENDFWYWQIDSSDFCNYFTSKKRLPILTEQNANIFANDADNSEIGCSCGSYESIEDILKEFEILK